VHNRVYVGSLYFTSLCDLSFNDYNRSHGNHSFSCCVDTSYGTENMIGYSREI
jgi:hypothetical protein